MSTIFISYRRADAGGHAGRLFDRLRQWFDAEAVFYDLDGIDIGDTFPARIQGGVEGAAVVLVLIGPDWLAEINRRADQPGVDFVRREVELALMRHTQGALVLPVLMGGAAMPSPQQFHAELAGLSPLCALDAHQFQGKQADWDAQFVRLRERIAHVPGVPTPRFRVPTGSEQPFRVIEHSLSPHFQDPNGLLARLHTQLTASGSAAVLARAALFGMGGVGKTQLALKYSHAYRDLYAGVWWFRAESETTLQLDAQAACEATHAPIAQGETPAAAFKRWLERQPTSWLLVYDNAEDVAALRPYLPENKQHHLLITSRNPAWGGLAQPVELEVWTPEQGADFLAARLPGAARAELLALAHDLDGLPLALEQAASYLDETGTSVADYRDLLASIDTESLMLDEGRAATGYERSVATTLSLAFDKLTPAAQQLLRLCAFAGAEPLPERCFHEAVEALEPDLAKATANPLDWNRVVGELRRYGLAQRSAIPALDLAPGEAIERTEQALSLHRLTQQTTRLRLAQPQTDCSNFQSVLAECLSAESERPDHWPRYAALAPHVTQLDRYYTTERLDARKLGWLLDRVASYLQFGPALYVESAHWFQRAWEIHKQALGEEHPDTLASMSNLASTLSAQGDLPGARALEEKVLEVSRRVLGEDHPETLASMNNLGNTLRDQGDLPGARALQEKVLEVSRRVLGEDHPDTLRGINNLASTLRNQGDLPGARALVEKVLEVRRNILGEDHPDTLRSMYNLACTLWSQGDLTGARALEEKVLEIHRHMLGDEHPDTLSSLGNLACTLRDQGDLPGARALGEKVLETRRRVLGEEHPATLSSMNDLAGTLWSQGDLPRARVLQEKVLEVTRRVLGELHPDTLGSMGNLAYTLWQMEEHRTALHMMHIAAEGCARVLGQEHPQTLEMWQAAEQMRTALRLQDGTG